jgi:ribosomal protein S12 methylthiotransferase accessory factor
MFSLHARVCLVAGCHGMQAVILIECLLLTGHHMSEQTFITGKDCALEESIARMQALLDDAGFDIEELQWINPVANVWSVHIRDRNCPLLFTNGKGVSRKAALASALGEFHERLATNYFFADYYLGEAMTFSHYPDERWFEVSGSGWPEGVLADDSLRDVYDPDGELDPALLVERNSARTDAVCALPYERQRDGRIFWFPVNLIANLYVSNGMSAGNNRHEARVQALSEIFERSIKFRIIAEGLCLPEIPRAQLERFPRILEAVVELEQAGFRLLIRDASLGGRYPVVNVTLINPVDGGCYASFGAHPKFEVALERAVTELLQGRGLDALEGFAQPSVDHDEVAHPNNLETHFIDSSGLLPWSFFSRKPDFEFHDWNIGGDTGCELAALQEIIHGEGRDIYIADYEAFGVYCCRVIVPGMSEIYPVDELLWNNNNSGLAFRDSLLHLPSLATGELASLLERLEAGDIDEHLPVHEFIGLAADPGSALATLRVGELKILLLLGTGRREEAVDWLDWLCDFGDLRGGRMHGYQCLLHILRLERDGKVWEEYENVLAAMFGESSFRRAVDLYFGKKLFDGLDLSEGTVMSQSHQQLFTVYRRVTALRART